MPELLLELEGRDVSRVEELHLVKPGADVTRELGRVPRGRLLMEGPRHGHVLAHPEPICNCCCEMKAQGLKEVLNEPTFLLLSWPRSHWSAQRCATAASSSSQICKIRIETRPIEK